MNLDAAVSTIMTKEVTCLGPEQKLLDLKHLYERPDFHSHVPVLDKNKLVGVVSLINFMYAIEGASLDDEEAAYHRLTVGDIMTPNPQCVSPETSIRDVAKILSTGEFHSLLIAIGDELKGIVTTTDILRKLIA